jgi:DNA-binding PadR family transcriptional regulator
MDRPLGELEQTLLYALVHLGKGASGVAIRDLIEERTGRPPAPGAIYTAFDRLEQRGLVRSVLGDPTPERGGKRRRLYTLTAAGLGALRRSRATLSAMADGLDARLEQR